MMNLFSVILFGLDGALISFQSMQWVCKVRQLEYVSWHGAHFHGDGSSTINHSYLFLFQARSWFLSLGFTLCLGSLLPRVLFAYRVVSWRPQTLNKVRSQTSLYLWN